MPSWIRRSAEPSVPQELMLDVLYNRYCPVCRDFKPQETVIRDEDRVLRCTVCSTKETFVFVYGVLIPEGTLPLLQAHARRRIKEAFGHGG